MKLPTTILTLLLTPLTPLTLAATDYENSIACAARNPALNTAIQNFCNCRNSNGKFVNNIVIPSPFARRGATIANNARVRITGKCNPPQWVPLQYCAPQFHAMRAQGVRKRRFGRNKCQVWSLKGLDTGKMAGMWRRRRRSKRRRRG